MAGDPINFGNWVALALLIVLGQAAAWTLVQYGSVWLHPTLSAGILLLSPDNFALDTPFETVR